MALARLASLPPELKLVTYYHFDLSDLLAVSHVSRFWRALVLGDRRWTAWFDMIVDPESGRSARQIMTDLKVLDKIPKRTMVNLCFETTCSVCSVDTTRFFLPRLKRICYECHDAEEHAVISLSAALASFDLSEKDVAGLVILHSPMSAKLVSALAVKHVAIEKYGGADKLATHLETRKARARQAYEARIADYDAATNERNRLAANGDLAGAAAVTLKNNNKKIPKTRPKMPVILKESYTSSAYQFFSVMHTNFLAFEDDTVVAQSLVCCEICVLMSEVCPTHPYSEPVRPEFLAGHQQAAHYARRGDLCRRYSPVNSLCAPCLNRMALDLKEERDVLKSVMSTTTVT